jgi:glycosyltransferase involved in cell wall biosynthesis
MKVLHVIPSLSDRDGGPSAAMSCMARSLTEHSVQVDVATTSPKSSRNCTEQIENQPDGWRLLQFRRQADFYKVSMPFRRWVGRHVTEYDLVHVHALFSFASVCAARAAYRAKVPYVVRPLGVLNEWGMRNRRPLLKRLSLRLIERPLLRRAAAVHYTSLQERVEAEGAGVQGRSVIIPLGVDLSAFEHLVGPRLFVERFPETAGKRIVLFLSRLDPKKGLDRLLPAFSAVQRSHADTILVIAGSGDQHFVKGLRRLAEELKLSHLVIWPGFLNGELKLSAFQAATVFVLPSHSENFGIALVEAMAAGLPCVTTMGVGIAQELGRAKAVVVTSGSEESLADALRTILSDDRDRQELGAKGRHVAHELFSSSAIGRALTQLYDQLVAQPAASHHAAVMS